MTAEPSTVISMWYQFGFEAFQLNIGRETEPVSVRLALVHAYGFSTLDRRPGYTGRHTGACQA